MIRAKFGELEIKGCVEEVLADYSTITRGLMEALQEKEQMDKEQAKKLIDRAYERGFKSVLGLLQEIADTIINEHKNEPEKKVQIEESEPTDEDINDIINDIAKSIIKGIEDAVKKE